MIAITNDTPQAIATWKGWISYLWSMPGINWAEFFAGNGGRWVVLVTGVVIGLIAWDVPQRIRHKLVSNRPQSPVSLAELHPSVVSSDHPNPPQPTEPVVTKWVSAAEQRAAEQTSQPSETKPIPPGEFVIRERKDKHGSLFLQVSNPKAESKTGYSGRIVNIELWSEALNDGAGGFVGYPQLLQKPRVFPMIEFLGRTGFLDHVEPKRFELIRNQGSGPWVVRGSDGSGLVLRDGVWRFDVEWHWNGCVQALSTVIRLRTVGGKNEADFVNQVNTGA